MHAAPSATLTTEAVFLLEKWEEERKERISEKRALQEMIDTYCPGDVYAL